MNCSGILEEEEDLGDLSFSHDVFKIVEDAIYDLVEGDWEFTFIISLILNIIIFDLRTKPVASVNKTVTGIRWSSSFDQSEEKLLVALKSVQFQIYQ